MKTKSKEFRNFTIFLVISLTASFLIWAIFAPENFKSVFGGFFSNLKDLHEPVLSIIFMSFVLYYLVYQFRKAFRKSPQDAQKT